MSALRKGTRINAAGNNNALNITRMKMFLQIGFKNVDYLINSFIAV